MKISKWIPNSRWIPRGFGWAALALAFVAGLGWSNNFAGYVTLALTTYIIWSVVQTAANLGAIETYEKKLAEYAPTT